MPLRVKDRERALERGLSDNWTTTGVQTARGWVVRPCTRRHAAFYRQNGAKADIGVEEAAVGAGEAELEAGDGEFMLPPRAMGWGRHIERISHASGGALAVKTPPFGRHEGWSYRSTPSGAAGRQLPALPSRRLVTSRRRSSSGGAAWSMAMVQMLQLWSFLPWRQPTRRDSADAAAVVALRVELLHGSAVLGHADHGDVGTAWFCTERVASLAPKRLHI